MAMMGKKIVSLVLIILATHLTFVGMAARTRPAFASTPGVTSSTDSNSEPTNDQLALFRAKPAHAFPPLLIIPVIAAIGTGVLGGIWIHDKVKCVTDIDCVVRNAVIAYLNTASLIYVGTTFTELTGADVQAMLDGEWDSGIGFAAAGAIDGAYENPPDIHLASYVKHKLSDNIFTDLTTIHAQEESAGLTILQPVREIWEAVRDAAYALFVIVAIVIGFMIILRKEISPRVVVTFTNGLPKLFIGLLLITFSFPLVALAYDVVGVAGSAVVANALTDLPEHYGNVEKPEGGVVGAVFGPGAAQFVGESIVTVLYPFADKLENGSDEVKAAEAFRAFLVFIVFMTFLIITLVLVAGQLLFRLAKLLVYTIFSPFIILIGSVPGQEGVLTSFAKNIITTVLAFPVIAFMFAITRLVLAQVVALEQPSILTSEFISSSTTGLALVFLTLVFMVLTAIAPHFIDRFVNPKK